MESAAGVVESGSGVVSGKRPADGDVDAAGSPAKRVRGGSDRNSVVDVKKVAEMVLVLAAMGKMRGGKGPTDVEKELMMEARRRLAEVCGGFAPKDVFPSDAFGGVMEDLGLSKSTEQRLGIRPPKMSIAEKILVSKRKMEKADEFALPSTLHSSRLHLNSGSAVENRSASHPVRISHPDKPSHMSMPSGSFQSAPPLAHNNTALSYQLPTSEIRPIGSSTVSSTHLTSPAFSRVDQSLLRPDGRPNGSPHSAQFQANNSVVRNPTWSMQPQSALSSKSTSDSKVSVNMPHKVEGAGGVKSGFAPQMMSRTVAGQTIGGLPLQGTANHAPQPTVGNSHAEIGKMVQKLLLPRVSERPVWIPPSRDYMNKSLTCQICMSTVTEIDTILICDACEKGYHLKCLHATNQKGVPNGEWHCGKCLSLSNGKTLPPKYGRVMRNAHTPKVLNNNAAVPSASSNQTGASNENVLGQPKVVGNGHNAVENTPEVSSSNFSHQTSGSERKESKEIQEIDDVSSRGKMDDNLSSVTRSNNLMKNTSSATVSSIGSLVEKTSDEKVENTPADLPIVPNSSDLPQTIVNAANASPSNQCLESPIARDSKESHADESLNNAKQLKEEEDALNNAKQLKEEEDALNNSKQLKEEEEALNNAKQLKEEEVVRDTPSEVAESDAAMNQSSSRPSSEGLHDVNWVGDPIQVLDEKIYYASCCINGYLYKQMNHVLIRFGDGKLIPSKLQTMWEDKNTSAKLVTVNQCYFPGDLPEAVGRPCGLESSEVYESTCGRTLPAGLIESSCEVLTPRRFAEESEKRTQLREQNDQLPPLYVCKWIYDEAKGLFRDISC